LLEEGAAQHFYSMGYAAVLAATISRPTSEMLDVVMQDHFGAGRDGEALGCKGMWPMNSKQSKV